MCNKNATGRRFQQKEKNSISHISTRRLHSHSRDITVINIYFPNDWPLKHKKQRPTEREGEVDSWIITAGNFSPSLSLTNRATRQKII